MNIEILTNHKGILAVASLRQGINTDDLVRSWPTAEPADERLPYFEILSGAIHLLLLTKDPFIRMVVGGQTIIVQRESTYIIAACIDTGHDVAKSLHRMIRRAAKPAKVKRNDPPPNEGEAEPHVCAGCIGGGSCDAQPIEAVEHDCAGCGAPPGTRCAKDCQSPHDGDDDDFAESIDDMAITERPL